jgi:hypothetical protein
MSTHPANHDANERADERADDRADERANDRANHDANHECQGDARVNSGVQDGRTRDAATDRCLVDRSVGFPHNGWVNHRWLLLFILIAMLVVPTISLSAKPKHSATGVLDREYVAALATANRFLTAWQTQDPQTGIILLTDAAKRQVSEDRLQAFFAPGSEVQEGYEINRGKKVAAGSYIFPVALFEIGPDRKLAHPRFSQIVVVNTGRDDWAIDKLP